MAIPLEYSPLTKVVPSDPDRLPYVPVQVLYLIAQALPQPTQIYNLARVNKATWEYLQPALYECEVTYETRLVAHFGDGFMKKRPPSNGNGTGQTNGDDGNHNDTENNENAEYSAHCTHGLVTALCEMCGQRIAIEKKRFKARPALTRPSAGFTRYWTNYFFKSRGMPALHWACVQGNSALPVARKSIEAAKAHNPSYIDGRGLRARRYTFESPIKFRFSGEIPPPLFVATAFGNSTLCVELVGAGCNVNLVQPRDIMDFTIGLSRANFFRIHDACVPAGINVRTGVQTCQWQASGFTSPTCETAGHLALETSRADVLGCLLDGGLDPLKGREPLIHRAARMCDLSAVQALIERYPKMACHRWAGMTPLHCLCRINGNETIPIEDLKSVAANLVRKGASLEAKGGNPNGPDLTPLEYALEGFTDIRINELHAAVALIMLGANWDRSVSSGAYGLPTPILSHCIREATLREPSEYTGNQQETEVLMQKRWRECRLVHAKAIKAIVGNQRRPIPDPVPTQDSKRHMQAFFGAFMWLVHEINTADIQGNDTFAVEAVGRLLFSTGIRPGRGEIKKWETLIARNAEESRADEWAASPWRELVADLPSAAPAHMHPTAETAFTT